MDFGLAIKPSLRIYNTGSMSEMGPRSLALALITTCHSPISYLLLLPLYTHWRLELWLLQFDSIYFLFTSELKSPVTQIGESCLPHQLLASCKVARYNK